jgi:hypothetical protein
MDFYAVCAYYWGLTRWEAKTRIIEWFYGDRPLSYGGVYVQINPRTLDFIPLEARADVLEFQGIILGES